MNFLKNYERNNRKKQYFYTTQFKDGYGLAIKKATSSTDIIIINEEYKFVRHTNYKIADRWDAHWFKDHILVEDSYRFGFDKYYLFDRNLEKVFAFDGEYAHVSSYEDVGFCAYKKGFTEVYDIGEDGKPFVKAKLEGRIDSVKKYNGKAYLRFSYYDGDDKFIKGFYEAPSFREVIKEELENLEDIDENGKIACMRDGRLEILDIRNYV